ncbi:MAG: hypothetical protein A3A44_00455 [Candidatus Sungbacteria bacterium RIFCSPLOWO2_01_FULL_60_25]|uniref:Cytidyltransferase-like domain-containing protein n=1 Tax=Candidatus Sungbacteria bacterium RIFCSPLOWO2_01_FULL_60_25 TaxID=1802281 RepID=A0A1G2L9D8_9BACT|nr:MAG: hypothetical protein A3A44_00455 [Candidatus Sungbacteria bacterium RIFCSPLOWO2_01_FULL_60_25]
MKKTGMVFGVFDCLHEGHKYFLAEAAKQCDELFVVVATDEVVEELKGHYPERTYENRVGALKVFNARFQVLPGDEIVGSWEVFEKVRPDIVFLGYDQEAIAEELRQRKMPFLFLDAHHPERYKSSLMHLE